MDVIAMHQAGFDNAVATLGTALTSEQSRLIAQYAQGVTLSYDSDGAGQAATRRAVGLLGEVGVKIKVLSITGAKDPDEYIKKFGAERFSLLLEGASNATEFEIAKLRQKYDCDTADGKVAFLREFVALMAGIPNAVERDVYLSKVASELEVAKEAVETQLKFEQKRASKRRKRDASELKVYSEVKAPSQRQDFQRARNIKFALAEDKLLGILMKNPDYYAHAASRITLDQMGVASELVNAVSGMMFGVEDVDSYIDTILSHKNIKSQDEVAAMTDDDLKAYIASLASKKKSN